MIRGEPCDNSFLVGKLAWYAGGGLSERKVHDLDGSRTLIQALRQRLDYWEYTADLTLKYSSNHHKRVNLWRLICLRRIPSPSSLN